MAGKIRCTILTAVGTSIDEPEGRGRTASLPVRYLRPGRRALSVAGPTAPRPALAGRLAAKASRRRSHFGGVVQARTRFARTSSIDFMVSQWNSGAPTEGAEGAGADGANATGAGSGSAYGSTTRFDPNAPVVPFPNAQKKTSRSRS